MARTTKISQPAVRESLPEFRKFIDETCRPSGVDDATLYDLKLAVDEACTNIIMYGDEDAAAGVIELAVDCTPERVRVTIHDRGQAFPPANRPAPDVEKILSGELRVGGFGMFLMHKTMDEVTYETSENGNQLTLIKRLGKED